MKRISLFAVPLAASLLLAGVAFAADTVTVGASAATQMTLTFPIPELGNCASKDECRVYCEGTTHQAACYTFAQAHNLMTKAEVQQAQTLNTIVGPGGCKGATECKTYCSDQTHFDECFAFAQAHHLGRPNGTENASSTSAVRVSQGQIGVGESAKLSTSNVGQMCRAYCSDPAHKQDCSATGGATNMMYVSGSTTRPFSGEGASVNANANASVNDTRPVPQQIQEKFGCATIAECKALCATSPDKCPTTRPGIHPLPPVPTSATGNTGGASAFSGLLKALGF